jgi:6,7-dimethyl-8-ribityllumazine synthase
LRLIKGEADGRGLKIGVVISRFNEKVTDRLLEGALEALRDCGVAEEDITVVSVPGAIEIPGVAKKLVSQVDLESGVPMTFGVLTTENSEQALARTGGAKGHKGYEVAKDAVELANTYRLIG